VKFASAFVDRFKKFYTSDPCPENGTYKTKTTCGKMQVFIITDGGKYSYHLPLTG
jgi:NADH:ubiquinone oxidoreductase subunit D